MTGIVTPDDVVQFRAIPYGQSTFAEMSKTVH